MCSSECGCKLSRGSERPGELALGSVEREVRRARRPRSARAAPRGPAADPRPPPQTEAPGRPAPATPRRRAAARGGARHGRARAIVCPGRSQRNTPALFIAESPERAGCVVEASPFSCEVLANLSRPIYDPAFPPCDEATHTTYITQGAACQRLPSLSSSPRFTAHLSVPCLTRSP